MGNWDYKKKDYEDSKITIPAGEHRVRIASVTPKTSKSSGNDMYEIIFDVSNFPFKIYYYLVFTEDNAARVNSTLGSLNASFGITTSADPLFAPTGWVGAVGAAKVKLEDDKPRISYFIEKSKQDKLPEWVEKGTPQQAAQVPNGFQTQSDGPAFEPPTMDDDTSLSFDL